MMQKSILDQAVGLRTFYDEDNQVGLALDALIADLKAGNLRDKTLEDAEAAKKLIGPTATAYRVINHIIDEINAS